MAIEVKHGVGAGAFAAAAFGGSQAQARQKIRQRELEHMERRREAALQRAFQASQAARDRQFRERQAQLGREHDIGRERFRTRTQQERDERLEEAQEQRDILGARIQRGRDMFRSQEQEARDERLQGMGREDVIFGEQVRRQREQEAREQIQFDQRFQEVPDESAMRDIELDMEDLERRYREGEFNDEEYSRERSNIMDRARNIPNVLRRREPTIEQQVEQNTFYDKASGKRFPVITDEQGNRQVDWQNPMHEPPERGRSHQDIQKYRQQKMDFIRQVREESMVEDAQGRMVFDDAKFRENLEFYKRESPEFFEDPGQAGPAEEPGRREGPSQEFIDESIRGAEVYERAAGRGRPSREFIDESLEQVRQYETDGSLVDPGMLRGADDGTQPARGMIRSVEGFRQLQEEARAGRPVDEKTANLEERERRQYEGLLSAYNDTSQPREDRLKHFNKMRGIERKTEQRRAQREELFEGTVDWAAPPPETGATPSPGQQAKDQLLRDSLLAEFELRHGISPFTDEEEEDQHRRLTQETLERRFAGLGVSF